MGQKHINNAQLLIAQHQEKESMTFKEIGKIWAQQELILAMMKNPLE